jgi:hypothetical protein
MFLVTKSFKFINIAKYITGMILMIFGIYNLWACIDFYLSGGISQIVNIYNPFNRILLRIAIPSSVLIIYFGYSAIPKNNFNEILSNRKIILRTKFLIFSYLINIALFFIVYLFISKPLPLNFMIVAYHSSFLILFIASIFGSKLTKLIVNIILTLPFVVGAFFFLSITYYSIIIPLVKDNPNLANKIINLMTYRITR